MHGTLNALVNNSLECVTYQKTVNNVMGLAIPFEASCSNQLSWGRYKWWTGPGTQGTFQVYRFNNFTCSTLTYFLCIIKDSYYTYIPATTIVLH